MRYEDLAARLSPADLAEVDKLIAADVAATPWIPLVNVAKPSEATPQALAYQSDADFLLYGGQAGGGKSDLLIGLAMMAHSRSLILRRESTQLTAIIDRIGQVLHTFDGLNRHPPIRWRLKSGRIIDMGGLPNSGDEQKYQGQPHDFIGFDELTQFLESQFRFVVGWNRSTDPKQRCRVVGASNPPTTAEGEWVIRFWAPWLDDQNPNPAMPGELRWFIMMPDGDREVGGPQPVWVNGEELIPKSRTFIPSSVDDNPFLAKSGYKATLQALPEPLRSQMLRGDFLAGREDDPWQVIPTAWVRAAQERWRQTKKPFLALSALGVDPARGGRDETVIARRYGDFYDELLVFPGGETPDGPTVASLVISHLKGGAPAHVDVIGIGSSVYDHLRGNNVNVIAINSAEASHTTDRSGKLAFCNKRSELWWRMREALEPDAEHPLFLPPDNRLLADLCAPKWKLTVRGVQVESKDDIHKRLGRSTDRGDAAVYALPNSPRKDRVTNLPPRANNSYSPHRWRK